jgi:hypothetical protein
MINKRCVLSRYIKKTEMGSEYQRTEIDPSFIPVNIPTSQELQDLEAEDFFQYGEVKGAENE